MDLKERLRLMRAAGKPLAPGARSLPEPPLVSSAAPTGAAPIIPAGAGPETALLGSLIPGILVPTAAGPAFCLEHEYPVEYRRGAVGLDAMLAVPGRGWVRLGRHEAWSGFDPASAAFFDTETTGLERGTGTYIFLAGVGRFVGSAFRVRQFFLRDYHEEPALLRALLAEFAGAGGVVTFNGRSFDWPILQSRCTMNRLPLPDLPHLDLLPPSRRLWQNVTESCRLVQLEAEVLGEARWGDVPGHQIPQLYFHYLHTGEAAPLAGVLLHNRLDIVSMAALGGYLGQAAADPLRAAPAGRPLPGTDLYAIGRLLLDQDELADALACLEEALARELPADAAAGCRRALGAAYKRAAQHDRAVEIWQALATESSHSVLPLVELAKHYEHRARDLATARDWTLRALEVLQRRRLVQGLGRGAGGETGALAREWADLQRRLQRLERKWSRPGGG